MTLIIILMGVCMLTVVAFAFVIGMFHAETNAYLKENKEKEKCCGEETTKKPTFVKGKVRNILDNPEYHFRKGNAYYIINDYKKAIDCYLDALYYDPNYTKAEEHLELAIDAVRKQKGLPPLDRDSDTGGGFMIDAQF